MHQLVLKLTTERSAPAGLWRSSRYVPGTCFKVCHRWSNSVLCAPFKSCKTKISHTITNVTAISRFLAPNRTGETNWSCNSVRRFSCLLILRKTLQYRSQAYSVTKTLLFCMHSTSRLRVCMDVCMYLCMCVCVCVCVCVRVCARLHASLQECLHGCLYVCQRVPIKARACLVEVAVVARLLVSPAPLPPSPDRQIQTKFMRKSSSKDSKMK
jgi:hypothetical protein